MKQHYRMLLESINHSAFLICKEKTTYPNKQLEKFSTLFMKHTFCSINKKLIPKDTGRVRVTA